MNSYFVFVRIVWPLNKIILKFRPLVNKAAIKFEQFNVAGRNNFVSSNFYAVKHEVPFKHKEACDIFVSLLSCLKRHIYIYIFYCRRHKTVLFEQ